MKEIWNQKGYVCEPVPQDADLKMLIQQLCKEKNAVILAHYYTDKPVQEVAHFIGDSLALARKAADTDADIIVMCGVHFMGETCKLLCPDKKVLIPDRNALCSLAESCQPDEFKAFITAHPDHKVISYVNTSASVKALTDIVVTSSNARQIVESFPKDAKLIFAPDRNLGHYLNETTGRKMLLWQGACHVHEGFSVLRIKCLKNNYPKAKVLVHPECKAEVTALADVVGSTAALLDYTRQHPEGIYIISTESGVIFEMQKYCPKATFMPVPLDEKGNPNECSFMRLNTPEKIYNCLKYEWPEVNVPAHLAERAVLPIHRMLEHK